MIQEEIQAQMDITGKITHAEQLELTKKARDKAAEQVKKISSH